MKSFIFLNKWKSFNVKLFYKNKTENKKGYEIIESAITGYYNIKIGGDFPYYNLDTIKKIMKFLRII